MCVVTVWVHEEGARVTVMSDLPTRVAYVGGATEAVVFAAFFYSTNCTSSSPLSPLLLRRSN